MKLKLGIAVFISGAVVALWYGLRSHLESAAVWLGIVYAILCFGFLIVQAVAFVWAHVDYDDATEAVKNDPILRERNL